MEKIALPKTDIKALAAMAELIASAAVIVSLVFVVLSLNQNTAALRSINDNLLYELQDSRLENVTSVPGFAQILANYPTSEKLSPAEALQLDYRFVRACGKWLTFVIVKD